MGDKLTSSSSSSSLAPGFRFHPTDEELVIYYLKRKVCGRPFRVDAISDIDIYKFEPWDLPDRSRLKSRDLEWYFFSGLDKKYGNGWRTNRATDQGYWKTTGKDRSVSRAGKVVGMKKTLVFHIGRAPHGERTNWVMHEYRLVDEQLTQAGIAQDAFVLCRVFHKSGPGPKNGEKYGAPFVEEEWEDWEDNVVSLKDEVPNDGYYGLPEDDYTQPQPQHYLQSQQQVKEERAVAIIPEPNLVAVDGSDHLENSGTLSGGGQNVHVSTGENDGVVELPDENAFILPEQFEMDQTINENEFFTLDDFLNPAYDGSYTDDPVDGEFTFSDALQDHPVDGPLLAFNGPNSPGVDQDAAIDECLGYFDAIDDSNMVDFDSSQVSDGVPDWDESVFTEEDKQTGMPLAECPHTYGNEGASSSEKQPEMSKLAGGMGSVNDCNAMDVKYNQGWDNSLAKQVSRMLGSFPAPTAYAAEIPTKGVAFGQNSAPHASTSVDVTAGMIHISGMAVFGNEKIWSVGKSGNEDLLLPYSMTLANLNLMGTSIQPMGNTLSSKATGVIMRSAIYFMFFWVLVLSMSCKIGSFIYTKQYI